jgi:hypothetical protein
MKDKTISERISEIKLIYEKLQNLGIDGEVCPEIKNFKEIANTFVKDGISLSGKIKLQSIDRTLVYILSIRSHITSSVALKCNNL